MQPRASVISGLLIVTAAKLAACAAPDLHVWEKQELTFTSQRSFKNPYTDVRLWVDLKGPGFDKRVYGFWDGGDIFRVRVLATAAGKWTWTSGSDPESPGLSGRRGAFIAHDWTEAEKQANPLRRGFLRPTANHHALENADGTPFFVIGDTWYSAATNRFRWYDDDAPRPIGPEAGFKDYVRFRKSQGYNWVNIIAAFPNWDNDGKPWHIVMNDVDHTTVRSAWLEFGTGPDNRTGTAKNMKNEGGRPFLFPGKVPGYEDIFPDVDRINPEYFKYLDRKIDYLNEQGFVPFIEVSRRDASECWRKYYNWHESYSRYIEYVFSRYQANNTVLSPIHLDIIQESITIPEFLDAINTAFERYGRPPFGNLLSANANPSTLVNWGAHSWVTLQQTGNKREHEYYWYLTQIFRDPNPQPGLNGGPYYAGYVDARGLGGGYKFGAQGGTPKDDQYVRSAIYGNVLSGGLAGHVYGAEGIWGADIEPSAPTHIWDAFQGPSGAHQHRHTSRPNRDDRLTLDGKVHGIRNEALRMSSFVQPMSLARIAARTNGDVRMQNNPRESPHAGYFLHHAFCVIDVFQNDDSGLRAEMQVPELMARGKRRNEKLFGIPSAPISAEFRIG
jgi:hypothetical protein